MPPERAEGRRKRQRRAPRKAGVRRILPGPCNRFPLFLLCRLFAESSELVHTIHGPCPRYEGGNKPPAVARV
ncbi:hypothetical protein, partial [Acidithiobacillus caldus]|uniref:hypothetical protein n=1 Tax=Acidithiobacillus caldus TaxID=33059 RepID=UPI001A7E0913